MVIREQLVRIAVADDHAMMREGLIKQLEADKKIEVVIKAKNGLDLLQQLSDSEILPDVAVIDVNMPVMDGFTLSEELKQNYPQIRILVLSAFISEYNVALMINNGVCGYLSKDCSPTEFRRAIHSIQETGWYYSKLAPERLFKSLQGASIKAINIPDREMEFLKLCCTDLSYGQIADVMGISTSTLNGTKERLSDRLNIRTRTGLVLFAVKSGISIDNLNQPKNLKVKSQT